MKHKDLINKKYNILKKHIMRYIPLEDIYFIIISYNIKLISIINIKFFILDIYLCKCESCKEDSVFIEFEKVKEATAIENYLNSTKSIIS